MTSRQQRRAKMRAAAKNAEQQDRSIRAGTGSISSMEAMQRLFGHPDDVDITADELPDNEREEFLTIAAQYEREGVGPARFIRKADGSYTVRSQVQFSKNLKN